MTLFVNTLGATAGTRIGIYWKRLDPHSPRQSCRTCSRKIGVSLVASLASGKGGCQIDVSTHFLVQYLRTVHNIHNGVNMIDDKGKAIDTLQVKPNTVVGNITVMKRTPLC